MQLYTTHYLTRAEFWFIANMLIYFLMNGAQIFETAVFVPKWSASPPYSFALLSGNGVSLKTFWIIFHSVHELIFIAAIIFSWKIHEIRNWLLILFAVHFAIRVWTLMYFAPHIIEFQSLSLKDSDELLAERVIKWKLMNLIRVSLFIIVSITLIPVYMKFSQYYPK